MKTPWGGKKKKERRMESWCILWVCSQQKKNEGLQGQPSERVWCEQPNPRGCQDLSLLAPVEDFTFCQEQPASILSLRFPSFSFLSSPLFSYRIFILFYFSIYFLNFPFSLFSFFFLVFHFPFILFSLLLLFFYFSPLCFLFPFPFFFPPNFALTPA